LLRNFEWYKTHRAEYAERTGVSHRVPWKQGVLRIVKRLF
jgi:hypothetical protein